MSIWEDLSIQGYPFVYRQIVPSYIEIPEIVRMTESGVEMTRAFNLSDCNTTPNSYFHDLANQQINIHTINSDTPRSDQYTFIAEFWVGITNIASQEYPAIFKPHEGDAYGATEDIEYYPFLPDREFSVTTNVGENYQDTIKMTFGQLQLNNAIFWYDKKNKWIFINRPFYIKVGELDAVYADYIDIFAGKLEEPKYNDNGININTRDMRYGILRSIPPEIFDNNRYPNVENDKINTPIPILFGIKNDILPVNISEFNAITIWTGKGGFELWDSATQPTYWRAYANVGSTVNRDAVNQRTGTYCCRLDIDAGNNEAGVRTYQAGADYNTAIWANPGSPYLIRFYYYNSIGGKTSEYAIFIVIDGVTQFWDNINQVWTTASTWNNVANALAYTAVNVFFYIPETAQIYDENSTLPLFFRFRNNSAASSSIYIDDFDILERAGYKISQTVFNDDFANRISIQSIDNVYQAGVEIFTPANYLPYLEAGLILFKGDPGSDEITCNAHGLKIEYDFTIGNLVSPNVFSENTADILYFTLRVLNQIPIININISDFNNLQSARTQRLGWYLTELITTIDFIKLLQRSSIFVYIINVSGQHTAKYYDRSIPADTKSFFNNDFSKYNYEPGTDNVFKRVVLKWDKHPMNDEYTTYIAEEETVSYIYGEERTLGSEDGITIALVAESEVESLGNFYLSLIEKPPAKISGTIIDPVILDTEPTDKIKLNRSVIDDSGNEVIIHDDELYAIIKNKKNLKSLTSDITAGLDTAYSGAPVYGDEDHQDHDDDHTDHDDAVHGDVVHIDITHQDVTTHDDEPPYYYHEDHTDHTDHSDHADHTDGIHLDRTEHSDQSLYDDETIDDPHVDHTDHTDTAHSDSPHTDQGHVDHDDHQDIHDDIPHTDSWL